MQWFKVMAYSRNTKPEFVILASLGVVSSIIGPKTKNQICEGSENATPRNPRKAYVEYPGLFITLLSEPGSGKSTAHQLALQEPLEGQIDGDLETVQVQLRTTRPCSATVRSLLSLHFNCMLQATCVLMYIIS